MACYSARLVVVKASFQEETGLLVLSVTARAILSVNVAMDEASPTGRKMVKVRKLPTAEKGRRM